MDQEKSAAELAAEMEANGIESVLGERPSDDTSDDLGEVAQATEGADTAAADAGQQSQAGTQEVAKTDAGEVEAPILGGGGKAIPYAVLKETRQRAQAAAAEAEAARAEADRLRAELNQLRAAAGTGADAARQGDEGASGEELYADLPDPLANKLRALDAKQAELNEAVNRLAAREAEQARTAQLTEAEQTQAVIDTIPTLAAWQAKGGPEWQAAVAADSRLMQNPAWADKPLAERIAKAAEIAALELGLTTPAAPPVTKTTAPVRPAAAGQPVASLTDITGGGMPAVDSKDYIEGSSTAQLAARMQNMSPEEIDRWLRETG